MKKFWGVGNVSVRALKQLKEGNVRYLVRKDSEKFLDFLKKRCLNGRLNLLAWIVLTCSSETIKYVFERLKREFENGSEENRKLIEEKILTVSPSTAKKKERIEHVVVKREEACLALEKFFKEGFLNVNVREYKHGETPLHRAVREGNLKVIKMLIDWGANVNDNGYLIDEKTGKRKGSGNTPLYLAIVKRKPEIAKLLLQHGADPEEIREKEGISIREIARLLGYKELEEILKTA